LIRAILGRILGIFAPVTSLVALLAGDVYAFFKPAAVFIAAYVNDFFALVGESEAGWLKCAVSVCLFVPLCASVTAVAFAVAYYQFVLGNAVLDTPIFFRYDAHTATAHLDHVWLTPRNAYSFELSLQYPESEHNHALGIVMATLAVELPLAQHANDTSSITLLREPRPLMPRYRSPLLRTMATVASAAPLILGLWHEETRMAVTLKTDWRPVDGLAAIDGDDLLLSQVPLHVSVHFDKPLQLYTSRLCVRPRLSGLSYVWSEWFWLTSFLFCCWMVFWQAVLYAAVWICLARCMVEELRESRVNGGGSQRRARRNNDDDSLYEWDTLLREHRAERQQRTATKTAVAAASTTAVASSATSTDDNDIDDDIDDSTVIVEPDNSSAGPVPDFSSKSKPASAPQVTRRRKSQLQQ
jgi:hypothetical protein